MPKSSKPRSNKPKSNKPKSKHPKCNMNVIAPFGMKPARDIEWTAEMSDFALFLRDVRIQPNNARVSQATMAYLVKHYFPVMTKPDLNDQLLMEISLHLSPHAWNPDEKDIKTYAWYKVLQDMVDDGSILTFEG
ncbi:MAG: hypothetical protein M1834_007518 [Cirrosporium novae-zelandiae]|nr:MAG: hypothetical protein M1834_007518 [Cirrosporium novae-zelandiae]